MLEDLKKEVVRAALDADRSGLCKHGTGNFSVIDRASGLMAISPSGMDREELGFEDVPLVDMDGRVAEPGRRGKPSSEYLMHIAAYLSRSDVLSVVHTHSPYATAFAIAGRRIEPVSFEAVFYGAEVGISALARPGTQELADTVAEVLSRADACLIRNHGALLVGKGIMETLLKAKYLESVAMAYYVALGLGGGSVDAIPREELERYMRESSNYISKR